MEGVLNATGQGIHDISSDQKFPLGTKYLPFGDLGPVFRYSKAGATGLAAGVLCQTAIPDSNEVAIAVATAAAIGALSVEVTAGAAVTAGYFNEGWMVVYEDAGIGHTYKIKSHETMGAGGTMTVNLDPMNPIKIALTTSSKVSLLKNKYDGLLINPTTLTGVPVGVTPVAVTANYYFWLCVRGVCGTLIDGAIAIGNNVQPSNGTAGSVEIFASGTAGLPIVGRAFQAGVSTKYTAVELSLE